MTYFDPVAISFVSKTAEELQELRLQYERASAGLWPELLWCYLRNVIAALIAFAGVMTISLLGLRVGFRNNPDPGLAEWIVGLGWFLGVAYFGSKWKWLDSTWKRWTSERRDLQASIAMHRSTVRQIDFWLRERAAGRVS